MTEAQHAIPTSPARAESSAHVLLTGVTGFVGQELLCQLVLGTSARVTCVVRGGDDANARDRLDGVLHRLFGRGAERSLRGRVAAVQGDVTRRDLGLAPRVRNELMRSTTHVLHGAASVRFDLPLADARRINVGGTMHAADFAVQAHRRGRLQRFGYVSTAFVGGCHPGVFCEDDLDIGQRFRNTYEQTKFEAEVLLRPRMRDVPTTIVRPSIVIGHSRSGATNAFNVIYWPLQLFAHGGLRVAPASPDLPVDVVPVDYVAGGAIRALFDGEADTTYALAAGAQATTAAAIGDIAARTFAVQPPAFMPRVLDRAVAGVTLPLSRVGPWQRISRSLRQFLPYFHQGSRFDTRHADQLLRPRGITPPSPEALLEPALAYALHTDFGRNRKAIALSDSRLARARRRQLEAACDGSREGVRDRVRRTRR